MLLSGPQIITEISAKLQFEMGRHLYGVLGNYDLLDKFEKNDLYHAKTPKGAPYPEPININRSLLSTIQDNDLKKLIYNEAKRPRKIQRELQNKLDLLLGTNLVDSNFIILKNLEILFAYDLDLSIFRTRAANQNHILLLLPGTRAGGHITIFHEATPRYHRTIPTNLLADNHIWELING